MPKKIKRIKLRVAANKLYNVVHITSVPKSPTLKMISDIFVNYGTFLTIAHSRLDVI